MQHAGGSNFTATRPRAVNSDMQRASRVRMASRAGRDERRSDRGSNHLMAHHIPVVIGRRVRVWRGQVDKGVLWSRPFVGPPDADISPIDRHLRRKRLPETRCYAVPCCERPGELLPRSAAHQAPILLISSSSRNLCCNHADCRSNSTR
jgi:hypothetical protein